MDNRKLRKFEYQLKKLILSLREERNNLQIHSNVDQFYYMQKLEELKLLEENVTVAMKRFEKEYQQVFCKWKADVRFVQKTLNRQLEV